MKPDLKLLFLIVSFTISIINAYSQSFQLKISSKENTSNSILDSLIYKTHYSSKKNVYKEIAAISTMLATKGFINNSYILKENDTLIACVFSLNKKINSIRVYYNNLEVKPELLKKISTNFNNQYFESSTTTIQDKLNTITKFYEKQGYTFIKTSLKNLILKNDIIEAELFIETTIKRTIDKIVIKGYNNFPKKYLKHYLAIKKYTVFNASFLRKTQQQINTIPFVSQLKNPEVLFTKDSTTLYIYLNKKNLNQFDGIIGFSNTQNNLLNINGYLNLNLHNIFNKGEQFDINWKNNGDEKTSLKLKINTPYILRSKFSLNGSFNIYRQDTTFNNIDTKIALVYNFNKNQSISSIASLENSNALGTIEFNGIKTFNKKLFGISYLYQPLYYSFKNKLSIEFNFLIGKRNTHLSNHKQSKGLIAVNYLWNLNSKNHIFIKNTTELLNTSEILENELFQIGGVNSIRGFDDQSILTSNYNITNLEYKFYTNTTNYLYTISDFGFIKNQFNKTSNTIIGLGIGYNFKSKNSIINLSYVLGKTESLPFKLNTAKLHIKLSYNF